jgi:hypothetical protein
VTALLAFTSSSISSALRTRALSRSGSLYRIKYRIYRGLPVTIPTSGTKILERQLLGNTVHNALSVVIARLHQSQRMGYSEVVVTVISTRRNLSVIFHLVSSV